MFNQVVNVVNIYVYPALQNEISAFSTDSQNFFSLMSNLAIGKAAGFGIIFLIVYLGVFVSFLDMIKREIWQTHSIINMIPDSILEQNKAVQEQVWKRRGVK